MSTPLRVAFNGSALLSPLTGIGQYAKSLAEQLMLTGEVDLRFFYATGWSEDIRTKPVRSFESIKEIVKKIVPQPYRVSRALQNWRFSRGTKERRPQLYHEPNFLPFEFDGPTLITAHDLSWIRYPGTHPRGRVEIMNERFPRALETAAHVITDAAYTRAEIMAEFGVTPERITSVPLGAREIFHPRSAALCEPALSKRQLEYRGYILCVGTLEPRKNLELVIRAYAAMPARYRSRRPLVLVGMRGWLTSSLEALMMPMVTSGQIRPLGYLPDDVLAALYAGAQVLVYPSIYEGFGLPPLEAMASGTPVIVSNRSTLPEVVGDAGLQVDAEDDAGLMEALARLDDDKNEWEARSRTSLERAASFSWSKCARETLALYHKALASA